MKIFITMLMQFTMQLQKISKLIFNYWQWNYKKQMIDRKNGEVYNVSPFALVWNDENYYMVAFDAKTELIKNLSC